ncbi:PfkB family carbohydrate kinase [Halorubrum ezzemoulense]|uniref:PfkB family carbohydrate kinase n=1 Tax=Halorubrum ezzemoulense TaxID=337243 RepID=A0ABT4Z0P8_HALEZ|nr:PfkB family carbohydrate kinase [Halorubrum ezzemoulense]MDB2243873.1 PfkB family carbohydrate kinase [Halorubrum ezzemoulense]MDB2251939.1 PfkB family carbohydrate kinase [Halorubrum ezzemoulense]MDB2277609.1 PfkB family carbohydrate kinase [Halorubrum ezzemoulense]MDB2284319.1 PfkB family carbohydrate kinase [Halorubrum ezzemoulense]MDB2289236.1 PfkB family carbohydrate kinase [Halorubrum ezzemoulense]
MSGRDGAGDDDIASEPGDGEGVDDWDETVAAWGREVDEWEGEGSGDRGDGDGGTATDGAADDGAGNDGAGNEAADGGAPPAGDGVDPSVDRDPDLNPDDADRVPKVVSAGHINWDVTIHVDRLPEPDGETRIDRLEQSGGGSAANVAVGLVDLGGQSVVYGSVGGDESGALALRELASAGVDPGQVLVDAAEPTSVKYVIVDGGGELLMLANDGANESFSAAGLDRDTLAAADHLHLTGQQPETAAALATAAAEAGATRSFDPGRRVADREFDAALHASDVLFVNDREADALAAATDVDPWEPEDRVVAIKLGDEGATVRTPHGSVSHPGFDVDPVDTTGAGDAFAAGFLAAALREPEITGDGFSHDPRDYQVPILVGNACGAVATESVTARTDLSWDRVRDRMGESPETDLLIEVRG